MVKPRVKREGEFLIFGEIAFFGNIKFRGETNYS